MPKNILIFSDGTGQSGGIEFDENRSNIYKLYRATRCGPDTTNNPAEQVCFYDPGLGSPADGGKLVGGILRWIYNLISQATGLGITANIIDCYAALIRLYRDGDRVFLFGFSRGAYTVRCLSGVLAYCGIPRAMPDGSPLPMDIKGSRKLAKQAIKNVYQFCSSRSETAQPSYSNFMLETRRLIARRFRKEHDASNGSVQDEKANVVPYFIGVFDTVATLAQPGLLALLTIGGLALLVFTIWLVGWLAAIVPVALGWMQWSIPNWLPSPEGVRYFVATSIVICGITIWMENYLKFDFRVPGYGFWKSLKTIHFARFKHQFYDTTLCGDVVYAKHAISIDENRKDFARVPWDPAKPADPSKKRPVRDDDKNIFFEQVWFAGVHSDIGGGYAENESRLSDITLRWMLAASSVIPNGIGHDEALLRLFLDPSGPQHDEQKSGWFWKKQLRPIKTTQAILHRSVYQRFAAAGVVQYDKIAPYRPENLREQNDLSSYYTGQGTAKDENVSDNIEDRWEKKKAGSAS
jgi:uncharacterized protein (DUF2235 family)